MVAASNYVGNVIDLNEYRAKREANKNTAHAPRARERRLPLGTVCQFANSPITVITVVIVGTWAFTGASGMPGQVETRSRRFRADPRTDETAQGYLLMSSDGPDFTFAHWGDVASGDLVPVA